MSCLIILNCVAIDSIGSWQTTHGHGPPTFAGIHGSRWHRITESFRNARKALVAPAAHLARPYEAWCATMQPRAAARERSKEIHSTGLTNKEVLQRLKSPQTPWHSIAQLLLEVRTNVNLVVATAAIAAYGRSQWQHALDLFGSSFCGGLRLDAVAMSACVSAVATSGWTVALWTLGRGRLMALDAPRGMTSAAMACGQQGEWTWSLRLCQGSARAVWW